MSNSDEKPKGTPLFDDIEIQLYPDGKYDIKRMVTTGTHPINGRPYKKIINNHLPECLCANPWNLHPPLRIHLGYTGLLTEKQIPLCTQCFEHNEKIKDRKKNWRIPFIYDPKTY